MNKLKPEVLYAFKAFLSALEKKGIAYVVLETIRTQEVQDAYFAQGRKNVGEVNRLRGLAGLHQIDEKEAKRVITHVEHSLHQDGIAADIVPVSADGTIPWKITKDNAALWHTFGRLGMEAGLEWGGMWQPLNEFGIGWDAAHYQLTNTTLPETTLNERLMNSFSQDAPLGLANGKMGFCLFAFWLFRQEKNEKYQEIAEKILDEIHRKIAEIRGIEMMNGLAGIGFATRFLLQEAYVKGEPNVILSDLDDEIYKYLSYPETLNNVNIQSAIHILYYLSVRLQDQKSGSENEYLYRELIITAVNHIYQKIDASFYEEPAFFGVHYLPPQFLFVLSRLYTLKFYNYRIIKILEEIGFTLTTTFPRFHLNRLFLMWGMDSVVRQVSMSDWENHIRILSDQLNVQSILVDELRSRNVFIDGGLSGVYLLLEALKKHFMANDMQQWMIQLIDRLESSDVWRLLDSDPDYFLQNRGLVSGVSGVSIVLSLAKSKYLSR